MSGIVLKGVDEEWQRVQYGTVPWEAGQVSHLCIILHSGAGPVTAELEISGYESPRPADTHLPSVIIPSMGFSRTWAGAAVAPVVAVAMS